MEIKKRTELPAMSSWSKSSSAIVVRLKAFKGLPTLGEAEKTKKPFNDDYG